MGKRKKTQIPIQASESNELYLLYGFLFLIILHIIGGFWHSYYSWGISYLSVFPLPVFFGIAITSLLAVIILYLQRSNIQFLFTSTREASIKSKFINSTIFTLVLGLVFCLFYYFRSKAHIYGDGYAILDFCSQVGQLEISGQINLQLLSIYWHKFIFTTFSPFYIFSAEELFALTNALGGVGGIWAIWSISNILFSDRNKQLFLFLTALSSGTIILFFGYIENYTWVTVMSLWSLRFMIGYLKKENGIIPLLLFLILSNAFHLIAFPFLLVGIYVILLRNEKLKVITKISIGKLSFIILLGTVCIVLFAQLNKITIFVPLYANSQNSYSLLSVAHLSDILNQLLLVAPMSIVLLYVIGIKWRDKININNIGKTLYLVSFLTFLSACFIDPELGAARDWDLFSLYGIPLSILVAYIMINTYEKIVFPNWIIASTLIIVLIHIIPNLYEKNSPEIAVVHLDKVLWEDPHYQIDYQDAYRGLSWGVVLEKHSIIKNLAGKYFSRRATVDKFDSTPLYNIGLQHINRNQLDSARYYLLKGYELNPQVLNFLSKLSEVECKSRNFDLAESYASKSISIDSTHIESLTALAIVYSFQKKIDSSLVYFRKVYDLDSNNYINIMNLGIQYVQGINTDSAYYYLDKSLQFATDAQKIESLSALISLTLSINEKENAIKYFNHLKSIAPNSQIIRNKEQEIYN